MIGLQSKLKPQQLKLLCSNPKYKNINYNARLLKITPSPFANHAPLAKAPFVVTRTVALRRGIGHN